MKTDVTSLVDYGFSDDELLPITKCACGARFASWRFSISIYEDTAYACPMCGRKFYFQVNYTIWEVSDDTPRSIHLQPIPPVPTRPVIEVDYTHGIHPCPACGNPLECDGECLACGHGCTKEYE